jgi:lysophospholipase L1-like esterase/mannose-6-phosphate isomerase-like protein (cupin superfamily)
VPVAVSAPDPDVRILLAGDSTMAAKTAVKRPETGWGEMLQFWFPTEEVLVVNHAKNGRSTRTFIAEGRWEALLEETRGGDYVFIQFGHNDQSIRKIDRYTPPEDFKANLGRFVNDVREREAVPVLLTPVVRRRFDDDGRFYDVHGVYPNLVRQVAAESGAALIDHHASSRVFVETYGEERSKELFLWLEPGAFENYSEGLEDNTHFSPLGARAMASLVMHGILESAPELARRLDWRAGGIVHETNIASPQGGPHSGGGKTTVFPFLESFDKPRFSFGKWVLHPGSTIGYHLHDKDEVYYILEGRGELVLNGETSEIGPGAAVFVRPGDSHGLRPVGNQDLVVIIVYENKVD